MNKLLLGIVAGIFHTAVFSAADMGPMPSPPEVAARGYFVMDFNSGRVLSEHRADERLEPASLTKIMTAYVAADALHEGDLRLDDKVVVSEYAWRATGSRTFIEVGKQVSVKDLLMGVIVQSGNDASIALAEHMSGSEEVFAELMNHHAERLGLNTTHYMNSTGLPHPDHFTTARDVAALTVALIRDFPKIYKWFAVKDFTYNGIKQPNRNRLLWNDESVDGVKTGHTEGAGYCLVSSAERGKMRLISVVLGSESERSRLQASQALLNYGFRFFETHRLYDALEPLTRVRIWKGQIKDAPLGVREDVYVTIPKRRYEELNASMDFDQEIVAPLAEGEQRGTLKITLGDDELLKRPLIVLQAVPEAGIVKRLSDELRMLLH